jgi:hypothetical protein
MQGEVEEETLVDKGTIEEEMSISVREQIE